MDRATLVKRILAASIVLIALLGLSVGALARMGRGIQSTAAGYPDDVVTYHNDAMRSGAYTVETALTPTTVVDTNFGLLMKMAVDGKVDGQPLFMKGFVIGGVSHNVVVVATEHDSVYMFDTTTGATLWQVTLLGSGETPSDTISCTQIEPEIGVTATPVIDRANNVIMLAAMSKNGSTYYQRIHELNLQTGAEESFSPVTVSATYPATGAPNTSGGNLVFVPEKLAERSALLLQNGQIYTTWTSHCDTLDYTGWMIAYNESNLSQSSVWNDEPSGFTGGSNQGAGSYWNSGSGPSTDGTYIYAMTANGDFDTTLNGSGFPNGNDYGNCILKLSANPSSAASVIDYFTMYNTTSETAADQDLGSGGLLLLPPMIDGSSVTRYLAIGAGKDKNLYLVDRNNIGKFNPSNNSNAYQVLASALGGGAYGAPVYFNGTVYFSGVADYIRAYTFASALLPSSATMETSAQFAYPGTTMSISANGTSNGILWAVENSTSNAILHAFNASSLTTELYNSNQEGTRDQFGPGAKWTVPTVADGMVFVGTQADNTMGGQNYVAEFGIL